MHPTIINRCQEGLCYCVDHQQNFIDILPRSLNMKELIHDASGHTKVGRVFGYALNTKKTKKKLLKGAMKTTDLNIEVKTGNTNLRFSGGAYCQVVLPLLKSWSIAVGKSVYLNQTEIKIMEFEVGSEISNKHVDTKVAVMVGEIRLVLHAYNSSQNLMVQGKNHDTFVVNCLEPFLKSEAR